MKNKLKDLNNHLFAQLERLSDEELKGDSLKEEINRSKSVANIARNIIDNGRLVLEAKKAFGDNLIDQVPSMLEGESKRIGKD